MSDDPSAPEPKTLPDLDAEADKPRVGPIDKAYWQAAKSWDRHRREAERREVNDPTKNRLLYNGLLRQAINLHGPLPTPREKDLKAHERLADVLRRRPADRGNGDTA
ncbi:MAG: hypothetical protein AAGG38_08855 [Planctomycetota bacterium]